jgi:uncharacterized lipoprotein YddW (UPF0748 family)
MTSCKGRDHAWLFKLALCCFLSFPFGPLAAQEFRALWVDAFHAGFRSSSENNQLLADARAGNFNAVIVEVRKRGDAYYNSNFEPKATDVSPQSFDPLADLVAKAHNPNNGPRIEVHAWIVTYPIWGSQTATPVQADHPFRLHPDWLTRNPAGATWNGSQYAFDPGHPAVQQHTFNVAMDIISRYDVDGLNFDYVRYAGNTWGYNSNAVARFNTRFNRTGEPATTDSAWLQWRRDQVSSLVRKVYLHAIAIKPHVKISADTICFAPGVTTAAGWTNSAAAYTSVLQDWRSWMEEGIIDMTIPMAYFDQAGQYAYSWTNWNTFTKDHRYNRHAVIGPGIYLNNLSNALFQMSYSRRASPAGNFADGVCGYSYAVPVSGGTARATFLAALTQTNVAQLYDPNPSPLFVNRATPPDMPWKTSPTRGHLKGFVLNGTNLAGFDGATVTLTGPTNRTLLTDASGFYGAVDLPVGNYTVAAAFTGFNSRTTNCAVTAGVVTTRDLALPAALPPGLVPLFNIATVTGHRAAIITWNSTNAGSSQVEYGFTGDYGRITAPDVKPVTNHSVLLSDLEPNTNYQYAVITQIGTNVHRSDGWSFSTAGDLILDNTEATYTGSWSAGSTAPDKFGADYRFVSTTANGSTASALFTPEIGARGNYDVFIWYPQGGNQSTNTPVTTFFNGTSLLTRVNQESGGGGWRMVGSNLNFRAGKSGFVRISNGTGETNQVVIADAVRFSYRAEQDQPEAITVPDWWAFHFFGSNVNAQADHDGDGYADWMEYLAGTNPTDATSALELALRNESATTLRASFAPWHSDRRYQLERRLETGAWQRLENLPVNVETNGQAWIRVTNFFDPMNLYRLHIDWKP